MSLGKDETSMVSPYTTFLSFFATLEPFCSLFGIIACFLFFIALNRQFWPSDNESLINLSRANNAPDIPPNAPANVNAPSQVLKSLQLSVETGTMIIIADIAPETKPLTNLISALFIMPLFIFLIYLLL